MKKITMKDYALKHKLSLFNVMKMVKSGKLESTTIEKNGKEHIYIVVDDAVEKEIEKSIVSSDEKNLSALNKEMRLLKLELAKLQEEMLKLKRIVNNKEIR